MGCGGNKPSAQGDARPPDGDTHETATGAGGAAGASVGLAYHDGKTARTVTLDVTGVAAAPALLVISDEPTYAFGDRVLTTSTDHAFTITNTGGVQATNVAPASLAAPLGF